jgi:hypothetical protein
MSKVINSATYQGYPVKSVVWKRSEGLGAEVGSVVIDYSVLKELSLRTPMVPWTGDDGGADIPGGLVISDWWELFGKRPGTRSDYKPTKNPAAGLEISGELILTSKFVDGKTKTVKYGEVFVLNAEEISENLAKVLEHKEGEIRIDITDIRQFYPRYGYIIGRINCRLENGKYDPKTIKKPGAVVGDGRTVTRDEIEGEAWPFKDVTQYLFSQLPGGPSVTFMPKGLEKDLPPPEEIDHIGSNAATVLQGVLDNYGLVAKLQPNGTYLVCRRNDENFLKPGEVAPEINKKETPDHIAYEKLTVNRLDTPGCVMVLGGRLVRQETVGYVPVFKDLDGKWYFLSDVGKVWDGYDIWRVNRQAAKTPGKYFHDVPPEPIEEDIPEGVLDSIIRTGKGIRGFAAGRQQDELHFGRRRIMREQAYRVYAPIGLFDNAPTNRKGAPYFTDASASSISYLPLGNVPLLESQVGEPVPGARKIKGDKGKIVLAPPVVRGAMLGEAIFTDVAQIVKAYDSIINGYMICMADNDLCISLTKSRLGTLDDDRVKADRLAATGQTFKEKLVTKAQPGSPQGSQNLKISHEYIKRADKVRHATRTIEIELQIWLDVCIAHKVNLQATIDGIKKRRGEYLTLLAVVGGLKGTGQLPYGTIPSTAYSLDSSTGILTFTKDVCCIVDRPIVYDRDQLTVEGDGMVSVTFGHQVDENATSDFTSIIFSKDGKGSADVAGANRPTGVKAQVVRDPDLVMYISGDGEPMNLQDCIDQARKKAEPLLEGPDVLDGHRNEFDGFLPCVLERGVNSVQYVWPAKDPEGGTAFTYVATHSPMSVGPAGRVQTTKLLDKDGPARTAAKQVEGS